MPSPMQIKKNLRHKILDIIKIEIEVDYNKLLSGLALDSGFKKTTCEDIVQDLIVVGEIEKKGSFVYIKKRPEATGI